MPRVNLSIGNKLFDSLECAAKQNNTTVNLLIINILEGIYYEHPAFDYSLALSRLIEETKSIPNGKEFTLVDLPSFSKLCVAKAEKAYLQPATVRARLGKAFNAAVRKGNVPYVKRATKEKNGETVLKFFSRAAVYVIDKESDNI